MRHKLCKRLFKFWRQRATEGKLPELREFFDEADLNFRKAGVIIVREAGDIFYDFCGDEVMAALGADILGQSMTFCYPEKFKALQLESANICFDQQVGLDRFSRFSFGHRHKDVEWLLLPARDAIGDRVVLVGMSATFVEHDAMDALATGSDLVERIIAQDYLSLGKGVQFDQLSRQSWAVLDAMGASMSVDGVPVPRSTTAMGGDAAYAARKASLAKVLAVANPAEFAMQASKLGKLYNFHQVETFGQALEILKKDRVDVLIVDERIEGGVGLDLIQVTQDQEEAPACVLMLSPRQGAEDTTIKTENGLVHLLVKPLGDFALRKAIDDAGDYVHARQKDRFYEEGGTP
ncbi:response regulator [Kordiimonas sp.]|uniref:response regulator n=1 Tax=Kordiimonas sp. TaxID=1970157 RepID=UPI003A918135